MEYDVDLLRDLLLELERREVSSPAELSLDELAIAMGRTPHEAEAGLVHLLGLGYIEGAGIETPGFFVFSSLTEKGHELVRITRGPRSWDDMKRHFAQRAVESGS